MNLENKVTCDMGVERADQVKDTLDVKHDKQELTAAVHMQNNDAGGSSEVGSKEMLKVSKDDCMEGNFMGSEEAKDLEALNDENECTNTTKEEALLPNKKVCKVKKVIKKRKLVKRKVTVTKDDEESQLSDMPDLSVEAKIHEDAKIEDNLAGKTMTGPLLDQQESAASVDMQIDVEGLASEGGDDEIFEVCKDDIVDGKFIGSENPQDLEPRTDAIALNDNQKTSKEVLLLPEKEVGNRKKVAKKRKLVKGKVNVAKDEEKLKQSNLPDSSVEVRRSQDVKNEKNHSGKTMNDSLLDKQELVASADMQNDETGLAFEVGDDKTSLVPEDDIREESVMGSEDAKHTESLTDAITKKGKEKIRDDTNSTNGMMPRENEVLKRKKIVKKRMFKGKATMAKAGEKPQTSDMPNMKEEAKSESKVKLTMNISHEVAAEDNDGAKPSTKHDSLKKVETMGMIFMCSSKTKEDCYRYKIMGLPANKKDAVLKVYKGMRLFLYDFELKLLYGIYKAAGPGGYNIEPDAFKSNFPSQVRFTAVRDCTPLPEEEFRNVIKDNYYTKNKFNSELNSEQVKRLCKLFQAGNKGPKSNKGKAVSGRANGGGRGIAEGQKKKRVRIENEERSRERRGEAADFGRDNKRRRVGVVKNAGNSKGGASRGGEGGGGNQRVKRNAVGSRGGGGGDGGSSRRKRLEDDARRRARFEDEARRMRMMEGEERRLRAADEDAAAARLVRYEEDAAAAARRARLEDEERRLRMEDNARRLRAAADDRRHSPLEDRYLRHPDVLFERGVPTVLDALQPPYSSYTGIGGRTSSSSSLHSDYRLLGAAPLEIEDRGLPPYLRPTRHLYDYETTSYVPSYRDRDPLVYRDHPGYDVSSSSARGGYYPSLPSSRDDHLPSSSRTSRYHLSPYRRY